MKKQRSFLKWAGGKYGLIEDIQRHLPEGRKLIEPFVGAGSVFLNTDYDRYLLADINPDLINLYKLLKQEPEKYIAEAKRLFTPEYNNKDAYLDLREQFNQKTDDTFLRSVIFLYMNRHGFNGLCRYNKSGKFNVPFGKYTAPYFPEKEMIFFAEKAKRAVFHCEDYRKTFSRARKGVVIYCDPPYDPISRTASFTNYASGNGFTVNDQKDLAKRIERAAQKRCISVVISNHDTELTRNLYRKGSIDEIQVKRTISSKGSSRQRVSELIAFFEAQPKPNKK